MPIKTQILGRTMRPQNHQRSPVFKQLLLNALDLLGEEMAVAGCNDMYPGDGILKGVTLAELKAMGYDPDPEENCGDSGLVEWMEGVLNS